MKMIIIPTSSAEYLALTVKNQNKAEVLFLGKNKEGSRTFPDGEAYIRIPQLEKLGKNRIVVLHSGSPDPNKGLVELEMVLQALKNNKIKPEVFFTYFAYGMQDKIFEKGEISAAEALIKKIIEYYGVQKIYIIDPHFGKEKWLKKYPVAALSALPLLMEKAKKDFGENILFLSPDKGGLRRTGISGLKKERVNSFQVEISEEKMQLENKTVAAVDDIIETGGTLLRFCDFAKKSNAKEVIVLATHGVLESGIKKIKEAFSALYLANTINQKEANVDITDLVLKNIER